MSKCHRMRHFVRNNPLAHYLNIFLSKAYAKAEAKKDCLTNYGGINYVTSI